MGKKLTEVEPFEPTEEQIAVILEANGIKDKRGGFREGSGRKKKNGGNPRPAKKKPPKLKPPPVGNPNLEHTAKSLVGSEPPKGRGRLTKKEMERSIIDKLAALGYDPVENLVDMATNPEIHGLEPKDRVGIDKELMKYLHPAQKSVEKKEEKSWRIEVVKRDFIEDKATGEVLEVNAEQVDGTDD